MSPKGRSPPMQPNPGTSKLRYPWPHLPVAPPSAFLLGQPERPCAPAPALLKRLNPGRGPPFMRPTKGLSAGGFRSWAWSIQNLGPARKSQVLLCRPYYPYPGARPNIAKRAPVRALRPVTVTIYLSTRRRNVHRLLRRNAHRLWSRNAHRLLRRHAHRLCHLPSDVSRPVV